MCPGSLFQTLSFCMIQTAWRSKDERLRINSSDQMHMMHGSRTALSMSLCDEAYVLLIQSRRNGHGRQIMLLNAQVLDWRRTWQPWLLPRTFPSSLLDLSLWVSVQNLLWTLKNYSASWPIMFWLWLDLGQLLFGEKSPPKLCPAKVCQVLATCKLYVPFARNFASTRAVSTPMQLFCI